MTKPPPPPSAPPPPPLVPYATPAMTVAPPDPRSAITLARLSLIFGVVSVAAATPQAFHYFQNILLEPFLMLVGIVMAIAAIILGAIAAKRRAPMGLASLYFAIAVLVWAIVVPIYWINTVQMNS